MKWWQQKKKRTVGRRWQEEEDPKVWVSGRYVYFALGEPRCVLALGGRFPRKVEAVELSLPRKVEAYDFTLEPATKSRKSSSSHATRKVRAVESLVSDAIFRDVMRSPKLTTSSQDRDDRTKDARVRAARQVSGAALCVDT